MKILYAENSEKNDYVFIVKTGTRVILFDCWDDKWRDKEKDGIDYFIPAKDVIDTVDPMDLKMAGSYIQTQSGDFNFPDGIEREFIKLTFNKKIERNL